MKKLRERLIFLLFIGVLLFSTSPLFGQRSVQVQPQSERFNLDDSTVPIVAMEDLDMKAIAEEDIEDEKNGLPPRFGYALDANGLNLEEAGAWTILANGDRIWRLAIQCEGARSINLLYEHFWLPRGATLHIYNRDRSHSIGAFTEYNNKGPREGDNRFSSSLVFGETSILELYEPKAVAGQSVLEISKVIHGYKFIDIPNKNLSRVYNSSGNCQVDVHCSPEGDNWNSQSESIAMIIVGGTRWCTGSLMNTTRSDFTPYFLTADHCLTGSLDAAGDNDAWNWSFWWDYDRPAASCNDGTLPEPTAGVTSGAILVSNWAESDFALFRLVEDPFDGGNGPAGATWFNGWNTTNSPSSGGVGLHHPAGDVMKIATHNLVPQSSDNDGFANPDTHWEIDPWSVTTNGQSVTEGGSSGSPLYMNNGQVIGQLHGGGSGNPNCSNPGADDAFYGKLGVSYDDNASIFRQLEFWLNPDCPSTFTMGFDLTSGVRTYYASDWVVTAREVTDGGANTESYLTLYGGNYVELQNGFFVDAGSNFLADNKNCAPPTTLQEGSRSPLIPAAFGYNADGTEWLDGYAGLVGQNKRKAAYEPQDGNTQESKSQKVNQPEGELDETGNPIAELVSHVFPSIKVGDQDKLPRSVEQSQVSEITRSTKVTETGQIAMETIQFPVDKIGDNDKVETSISSSEENYNQSEINSNAELDEFGNPIISKTIK